MLTKLSRYVAALHGDHYRGSSRLSVIKILLQGVRVGDLVIEFGSVNVDNFKNLQDIGSLVQHSQGVGNHYRSL